MLTGICLCILLLLCNGSEESVLPYCEQPGYWLWWSRPTVLSVVDGDSIRITAPFLPAPLQPQLILRLVGVDAPEQGWRAGCAAEAEAALAATNVTQAWVVAHPDAVVRFDRWDKFGGRVLGDLVAGGVCLTSVLLARGVVRPYNGRTRPLWCV